MANNPGVSTFTMRQRSILYYEARSVFGLTALLPVLALPCYALLGLLVWQYRAPTFAAFVQAFELSLPLAMAISAAHLMCVEKEEYFAELRHSYAEPSWRIPVLRTVGALALMLIMLVVGILFFGVLYPAFDMRRLQEIIVPALPPTLYLAGLALLIGNLSQSTWIAAVLTIGYWFYEFSAKGELTQTLFLFDKTLPRVEVAYDLNRVLLLVIGLGFIVLNIGVSVVRRR